VAAGEPVATIHFNSETRIQRARQLITDSCVIANAAPATKRPLIHRVIQRPGEKH
jgi:thymidine phosphorylase